MSLDIKNYKNRHAIKFRVARILWAFTWMVMCRWTPSGIGFFYRWRIFWLRVFGAKIGKGVHVYPSVRIWQPWTLEMCDYSCLASGVDCYSVDRIVIGENVVVSQDSFLCTASHDISSETFELSTKPIFLSKDSWVGARAIIFPGTKLGKGAVVAAGAVVVKDVPDWNVVGGNPARTIKMRTINRC